MFIFLFLKIETKKKQLIFQLNAIFILTLFKIL